MHSPFICTHKPLCLWKHRYIVGNQQIPLSIPRRLIRDVIADPVAQLEVLEISRYIYQYHEVWSEAWSLTKWCSQTFCSPGRTLRLLPLSHPTSVLPIQRKEKQKNVASHLKGEKNSCCPGIPPLPSPAHTSCSATVLTPLTEAIENVCKWRHADARPSFYEVFKLT